MKLDYYCVVASPKVLINPNLQLLNDSYQMDVQVVQVEEKTSRMVEDSKCTATVVPVRDSEVCQSPDFFFSKNIPHSPMNSIMNKFDLLSCGMELNYGCIDGIASFKAPQSDYDLVLLLNCAQLFLISRCN